MAQLTDDCFAFNGPLMRIAEMEKLIAERVTPVEGRESVPLREALGRVLASDVVAPVNVPPFDNSAVDGYAVRAEDLKAEGETRLTIVERVRLTACLTRSGPLLDRRQRTRSRPAPRCFRRGG